MLAIGTDLTTFGLNLNSSELLYLSFRLVSYSPHGSYYYYNEPSAETSLSWGKHLSFANFRKRRTTHFNYFRSFRHSPTKLFSCQSLCSHSRNITTDEIFLPSRWLKNYHNWQELCCVFVIIWTSNTDLVNDDWMLIIGELESFFLE